MQTGDLMDSYRKAGDISLHELLNQGVRGECLPVVRRKIILEHPYVEKLRGCESLAYIKMLNAGVKAFLSSSLIRIYDSTGKDRLSKKAQVRKRAKSLATYNNLLLTKRARFLQVKTRFLVFVKLSAYAIISRMCG